LCAVAMFTGNGFRRHTELRGRERPVRVCEAIEKSEVLEFAIGAVKAIPLRLFEIDPDVTVGIGTPACCSHQSCIKQSTCAIFRSKQETRVKQTWSRPVVQITLIFVEITDDLKSPVTKLQAGHDRVITSIFPSLNWTAAAIRIRARIRCGARRRLLCLCN